MEKIAYEKFRKDYLANGKFPLNLYSNTNRILNEKQIEVKYQKYCSIIDKNEEKGSRVSYADDFNIVRDEVYKRDNSECRLWKVLNYEEKYLAKQNGYYEDFKQITPAHFVRRSTDQSLICEVDNIYTLSLVFHSRLDQYCDPIIGVYVGKGKIITYWKRIINNDEIFNRYKDLYLK